MRTLGLLPPDPGGGGGRAFDGASLLHRERERRLMLKLLRYIVDSNFFLDEDASGAASSCAEAGADIAEDAGTSTSR